MHHRNFCTQRRLHAALKPPLLPRPASPRTHDKASWLEAMVTARPPKAALPAADGSGDEDEKEEDQSCIWRGGASLSTTPPPPPPPPTHTHTPTPRLHPLRPGRLPNPLQNPKEFLWTYMRADPEGLRVIQRLSGAGKLQILVEKTFPISEVREGHEAKEKGRDAPGPTYSLHASQFMDHHMKELLHQWIITMMQLERTPPDLIRELLSSILCSANGVFTGSSE